MDHGKTTIIDSLLRGFQGVLFDDSEMLTYTIRQLVKRHFESHVDAGRKVTSKSYLAAIGALEVNNIRMERELRAMEEKLAEERKEKAAKKARK